MVFEEAQWKTAILRKQQKLIFFVAVTGTVILTTTIDSSNNSNLDNKQTKKKTMKECIWICMRSEMYVFYVVKSYLSNRN